MSCLHDSMSECLSAAFANPCKIFAKDKKFVQSVSQSASQSVSQFISQFVSQQQSDP